MTRIPVIARINEVTDRLLNDDDVYSVHEVASAIAAELPKDYDLTVIIREPFRFSPDRSTTPGTHLLFPYLSFSFRDGKAEQFPSRSHAEEAIARLRSGVASETRSFLEISNNKYYACATPCADESDTLLVKAVARCILTFYYTCHSHDHFMSNVTRLYLSNFFKDHEEPTIQSVIREIENRFGVSVAFARHTSRDPRLEIEVDTFGVYERLSLSPSFSKDIEKAIRRKGEYIGQTEDADWNYAIHTLTHEFFDHARANHVYPQATTDSSHAHVLPKFARKAVLIIAGKDKRLKTDALKMAPKLVESFLASQLFLDREQVWFDIQQFCASAEDAVAEIPAATKPDLDSRVKEVIGRLLDFIISHTLTDGVALRMVDPFKSVLTIFEWRKSDAVPVPAPTAIIELNPDNSQACAQAFLQRREVELEEEIAERRSAGSGNGSPEPVVRKGSILSTPVYVGTVLMGTLDCYSRRERAFEGDHSFIRFAAKEAGAILRRFDLANDSAWLSRLSFLHAARHKLEQFGRELEAREPDLHARFSGILRHYKSLNQNIPTVSSTMRQIFAERLNAMKLCHLQPTDIDCFLDRINDAVVLSERARVLAVTAIDTLLVNALEHLGGRAIRLSQFTCTVEGGEPPTFSKHIIIKYHAPESRVVASRLVRICRSPIPDDHTETFHFGLFLLAAQVRMMGGGVFVCSDQADEIGNSPLILQFAIPVA